MCLRLLAAAPHCRVELTDLTRDCTRAVVAGVRPGDEIALGGRVVETPTDVNRSRAANLPSGTLPTAHMRRDAIAWVGRGLRLVRRYKQKPCCRFTPHDHLAANELVASGKLKVGLGEALGLVHKEVVAEVSAQWQLARLFVHGDAKHNRLGRDHATFLYRERRNLVRRKIERVASMRRDDERTLNEAYFVALDVVGDRHRLRYSLGHRDAEEPDSEHEKGRQHKNYLDFPNHASSWFGFLLSFSGKRVRATPFLQSSPFRQDGSLDQRTL